MDKREQDSNSAGPSTNINVGYLQLQIAKAIRTSIEHQSEETRKRAKLKAAKWQSTLHNLLNGFLNVGSRAPIPNVPVWATLEVLTGGFASGGLLAGGPLLPHEQELLETLQDVPPGYERSYLNGWYMTEEGLATLNSLLESCEYEIRVPEEGALLVVAWLIQNHRGAEAARLLDTIDRYLPSLRFYPVPREEPLQFNKRVHVNNVGDVKKHLEARRENTSILAQKRAVEYWAPHHDKTVSLFLETVKDGRPCTQFPSDWQQRAAEHTAEFTRLCGLFTLSRKYGKASGHAAQLRNFLRICANAPQDLTELNVKQIAHILGCYHKKRGAPGSVECVGNRQRQVQDVSAPSYFRIGKLVLKRLEGHAASESLESTDFLVEAVSREESLESGLAEGVRIPDVIKTKAERCLSAELDVLFARGLVKSGEVLAEILPQLTADTGAAGITDPKLRYLYASVYRAFRCRRSLLLLNLEKQIQIEELPWIKAIEEVRKKDSGTSSFVHNVLEDVVMYSLRFFPQTIIPNRLLQELRALAKGAQLNIPITDELAADIFIRAFSNKYLEAAQLASDYLEGSLYARYYDIDNAKLYSLKPRPPRKKTSDMWPRPMREPGIDEFAKYCIERANVPDTKWSILFNGRIIEQQQVLTTHNLAVLVTSLNLTSRLRPYAISMARQCFTWVCVKQQITHTHNFNFYNNYKNCGYAWRQMVFFLSLLSGDSLDEFISWAQQHFEQQGEDFQERFQPFFQGLELAIQGAWLNASTIREHEVKPLLGWYGAEDGNF